MGQGPFTAQFQKNVSIQPCRQLTSKLPHVTLPKNAAWPRHKMTLLEPASVIPQLEEPKSALQLHIRALNEESKRIAQHLQDFDLFPAVPQKELHAIRLHPLPFPMHASVAKPTLADFTEL